MSIYSPRGKLGLHGSLTLLLRAGRAVVPDMGWLYRQELLYWFLEVFPEVTSGCTGGWSGCTVIWLLWVQTGAVPALHDSITEAGPVVGR